MEATRVLEFKKVFTDEMKSIVAGSGNYVNTFSKVVRTIPHPDAVKQDLHVGFFVGNRKLTPLDTNRRVYAPNVDVTVQIVKSCKVSTDDDQTDADNEMELVIADFDRKLSELEIKYLNNTDNPWNVAHDEGDPECFAYLLTEEKKSKIVVIYSFKVKFRRKVGSA